MNELLERTVRIDAPGAARIVKAARMVHRDTELTSGAALPARWPALRGAMLDGAIGVAGMLAATGPIEQAGDRIGAVDRFIADAELAAQARGWIVADRDADADADAGGDGEDPDVDVDLIDDAAPDEAPPATPEDLRQFAHLIAMYLDPDGSAPTEAQASNGRSVTIGRLRNRAYPIRGNLLPEVYAQLQLIFDAQLNPKVDGPPDLGVQFRPSNEAAGADGNTYGGYGQEDGSNPFNCDPRNVIDARTRDEGRIIGISVTDRVFTIHQRRAIILRDKECLIPGVSCSRVLV